MEVTTTGFTTTLLVEQSPAEVFKAVRNVRGWWSEGIKGGTENLQDEFTYRYKDVHFCRMKLTEVVPGRKVVWLVTDSYLGFVQDKTEWNGTEVHFDIRKKGEQTELRFTHAGLVPEMECYSACYKGWSHYIHNSLLGLITTGKGQPNTIASAYTVHEVAARYSELARQEKWFEIQDEFFSEDVKSIEPPDSPYLSDAEGKAAVRLKAKEWVKKIEAVHKAHTTQPIVAANHFAVGREMDITVQGFGRIQMNQVMVYEVKEGKIVKEQFFY